MVKLKFKRLREIQENKQNKQLVGSREVENMFYKSSPRHVTYIEQGRTKNGSHTTDEMSTYSVYELN